VPGTVRDGNSRVFRYESEHRPQANSAAVQRKGPSDHVQGGHVPCLAPDVAGEREELEVVANVLGGGWPTTDLVGLTGSGPDPGPGPDRARSGRFRAAVAEF